MNLALQNIETTLEDTLDYRNEPVIASTSYLSALGFGIVVKMDKAEVFKTSYDLKVLILTLIVGLVLIVIIISIFLSNMITKQVINIIETATMISRGDYQKRILAISNDEIGQLANALNEMAEKFILSNQILEEKVKKRTEELGETNDALGKEMILKEKIICDLEKALSEIKTLSGLLPICSHCKKIRDDKGYWNQIEAYLTEHSEAKFSHGICKECAKKYYPDFDLYDD